jgi:hypothetical protein
MNAIINYPTAANPEHLTALDASQDLIGLFITSENARAQSRGLPAEAHFEPVHSAIWRIALAIDVEGGDVLPEVITCRMTPAEIQALAHLGGPKYLSDMAAKCGHPIRTKGLVEVVERAARLRSYAAYGAEIVQLARTNGDPERVVHDIAQLASTGRKRFNIEFLADITPSETEWLVPNLVPEQGYGFVSASSGGGKSFFVVDIALRLANGRPILGRGVSPAGCLYIASEGAAGVRKRVKAWQAVHGGEDFAPFAMIGSAPDLQSDADVNSIVASAKDVQRGFEKLASRLALIVIDTLSQSVPGANENDAGEMSRVMSRVQRIASQTGAFVLVVHHTGKDQDRGMRGSSVLRAAADLHIEITQKEGESLRVGRVAKLKDGEDGERFAFSLEPVDFEFGGRRLNSCVPDYQLPPSTQKATGRKPLTGAEANVLTAIHYLMDNGQPCVAPEAPGVTKGTKAVRRDSVRERARDTGFSVGEGWDSKDRQAFHRALLSLQKQGKIRIEGDLVWPL